MIKRIRPAKHYQRADNPVRALILLHKPKIKRDLRAAFDHLGDIVPANIARLVSSGRWREIAGEIDFNHYREVLKKPFQRIADAYESGAQHGVRKINGSFHQARRRVRFRKANLHNVYIEGDFYKAVDVFNFDLFTPDVQQTLRDAQDALIQQLEASARDAIETIVMNGAQEGLSAADIVDDIRNMIGLTDTQAQAVMNYRSMLESLDPGALQRQLRNTDFDAAVQSAIDNADNIATDAVDQMVQDYADNYLDYRASTIAQTESVRAVNEGLHDAYSQAIDRGALPDGAVKREWQLGDSPCFPAGTMVLTKDGNKPIETIANDFVLTRNGWRRVRATIKRIFEGTMVLLKVENRLLICTDSHPIFVNGDWLRAIDIKLNDSVQLINNQRANVSAVFKFILTDANGAPTEFRKSAVATRIFGSVSVPISTVKLQSNTFLLKREINRIATNLKLLGIDCSERIECDTNLPFWNRFALKTAIAFKTTELAVMIGRFTSKFISATSAIDKLRRHIAVTRTIFSSLSFAGTAKHFSASNAFMFRVGEFESIKTVSTAKFSNAKQTRNNRHCFGTVNACQNEALPYCRMVAGARAITIDAIQPSTGDELSATIRAIIGEWHESLDALNVMSIVYDLEIEGEHEFFANGILVHNCPICESIPDNNPDGVGVDEDFESDDGPVSDPPVHPNCMCSVDYVTDISQVPDDSEDSGAYDTNVPIEGVG